MRLSKREALDLIKNADLIELGQMALAKKRELHPKKITTFIVDRNINYTNICWVDCDFCAFYRKPKDEDAYVLSYDEIDQKIEELLEIGGTQILFQGGVHPKLKIDYYEDLVEHIHTKYPQITIHGFSAVEISYIAKVSRLSYKEVLERLKAKGLSSIPGAGAEILSDRVREIISPKKLSSQEWLDIHKAAHEVGMKTTATMMYGTVESDEEIVEHWEKIRDLQDETGGFRAFIMWSFQPYNTALQKSGVVTHKTSSNRYLRLLAVSRLFLDNFKNIQSSWVTQGSYIGQLALLYGANDLGSTMMEENVVKAAGAQNRMNQEEMIRLIKDVGEIPAKRNTAYEILEVYE
ncbi:MULTISPECIES: dehypoxanthine futalosine cyclase [unclassified Nitratiruptor]|uniref:dehypoxanthine futalosine cyclase n=1 Tax=unclassified Nitratiruptor TaxID=2624044 RepID=UPI0019155FC9|nr:MULTISPECIES: dehypoxanthine futalosine cyclase [unclassified Nitratiruptor]BCD60666.1 cyclic dehypoxanthinyl futalosine synthase [Nitratiruptor sp. YY08-10]BCD64597.1 cyclic dehypoxanthinyl futalosine synthase [Nitratiruptor sp. YY08-14]